MRVLSVLTAALLLGCTKAPPPTPDGAIVSAPSPPATIAPVAHSATAATATSATPALSLPVEATTIVLEPSEPGAPLIRSEPAFEAVRNGKPLKVGSEGPAVLIVQTMLAAWNYPIAPADITGKYDAKTAVAVLSYRLDSDLSKPAPGPLAERAKAGGVFDQKVLAAFESRVGAKMYRTVRAIDAKQGIRIHLSGGATPASALAAIFPDEAKRARATKWKLTIDSTDPAAAARGETVAWLPIPAYVCGASLAREGCEP